MKKTIKQLEEEVGRLNEVAHRHLCDKEAMRQERNEMEEKVKTTREQFADLKKRLLDAETELARLRGYLERVHEDDIVRDGMVEIEDAQGKRQVPKRFPPMNYWQVDDNLGDMATYDNLGRRKNQTHWTSY